MSYGKEYSVVLAPTFVPTTASALAGIGQVATAMAGPAIAVAAAAGAVFLTRAALRGLVTIDCRDREAAAAVAANRAEAMAWEQVFTEVMIRNARLTRLRAVAAAQLPDGATALPAPLTYRGENRAALDSWCADVDTRLSAAERHLTDLRIRAAVAHPAVSGAERAVRRRIELSLLQQARPVAPTPTAPPVAGPDPARPGPRPVTTGRPDDPAGRQGGGGPDPTVQPMIDSILAGAAGEVAVDDLVELAEQAERVLAQRGAKATKAELDELYLLAHVARQRQRQLATGAEYAARLLVGLAPLADSAELSPEHRDVLRALHEVAAELRPLDDDLRTAAEDLADLATQAATDRVIVAIYAEELAGLGYTVQLDQPGQVTAAHMSVSRPEWGTAHSAEVELDRGTVRARFRTAPTGTADGRPDLIVREWADHVRQVKRAADLRHACSGALVVQGEPEPEERADDVAPTRIVLPQQQERPTPR